MKQVNQLPHAFLNESLKNIDKLSNNVCEYLQIDSKQHKLHVLQRQQEIVIIVEEPILASQLKYQQKAILKDINQSLLCEYKTIKIKLSPPRMLMEVRKKAPKPLADEISALLDHTRKHLDTD